MPLAINPEAPPHRLWRGRPLLTLLPLVLLFHALLLGLLPLGVGGGWKGEVRRPLTIRQITLPAPPPSIEVAAYPSLPPVPAPAAVRAAPAAPVRAASAPEPEPPPAVHEPVQAVEAAASAPETASSAPALATVPSAPEAGGQAVPVYATQLPGAVRLAYELRRGMLSGQGELIWQPREGGYELSMEGNAFALNLLAWTSRGGFDGAGLAPERFVDRRRGRELRAANFQRDKGLITFSGPSVEYPLVPGAQDRLSWMVQLPAIVAADPTRFGVGERITMFVAGARGDGDLWSFRVEALETVDVPAGAVPGAMRLRREPRRPYDTQVDVWLDPARSYLVVRARLATPQTDDATEFLLRQATPL